MSVIGQGVSLRGIYFEDWQLVFNVSGSVSKSDVGKAVAIDPNAVNSVRLAADGDHIFGRLQTLEVREIEGITIGTVAVKFSDRLPIKSGQTINVGDYVTGAGNGEIKSSAGVSMDNYVVEVDNVNGFATVIRT